MQPILVYLITSTVSIMMVVYGMNQQAYSGLYGQTDENDIIMISTEEDEEDEEDEDTNNVANEQALCSKYLESCPSIPTPTPPPVPSPSPSPEDLVQKLEENFREKYLQENSNSGTGADTIVSPNATTILQTNGSSAVAVNTSSSSAGSYVAPTGLQDNFQVYQNPVLGIRLEYPTEWQLREEPVQVSRANATIAFFSPFRDAGFRIEVADIKSQQGVPASLGPLISNIIDRFSRQYPDFQIISTNATAMRDSNGNNIPAYQMVFFYTSQSQFGLEQQQQFVPQDKRLLGMFVFSVHNNRSFLIEAYSEMSGDHALSDIKYSSNLLAQQRMLSSLQLQS